MRCRPAAPVHGEAADIVAVTRDITERKAHERALIEARDLAEGANRAKSQLPRQYEPRTAHAAERHHRLLRSDDARDVRARRSAALSRIFAGSSTKAAAICSNSSTAFSTCRRSRPASSNCPRRCSIWTKSPSSARALRASCRPSARAWRSRSPSRPARSTIFADKRAVKQMLVNLAHQRREVHAARRRGARRARRATRAASRSR